MFNSVFLARSLNRIPRQLLRFILISGLIIMLLGQLFVLTKMPVTVFHDPYRVLAQADRMAAGNHTWNTTYFWRNSNNITITYFIAVWLRLGQFFGMNTNIAIHLFSLLMLDSFILLLLHTVWQLSHRESLLLGALSFAVLTPFAYTYYLQVFYSDLPIMLALLIIIRTIMNWPARSHRHHLIAGSGLLVTVLLAGLIKPNLIVLLPALALVVFVLWHQHALTQSQLVVPIVLILLGFGLTVPATHGIQRLSDFEPKAEYQLPITHWMLMGLNASEKGMFAPADASKAASLPDEAARQSYNLKEIPKRIRQLGVGGVTKLWLTKLEILLDTHDVQTWYNGGFRNAPSWYHNNAQPLQLLTRISYTAATIAFLVAVIGRLLTWRPDYTDSVQVGTLLAIITALGYLAFHTLVWETEPRYGQVVVPLLWLVLAGIPAQKRVSQSNWVLPSVSLVLSFSVIVGWIGMLAQQHPQTTVIAAQRSQLSEQYQARPLALPPRASMSQEVELRGNANYFSVQVYPQSTVSVILENTDTQTQYRFKYAGPVYRLKQQLIPGHYRIVVSNITRESQVVDVVSTYHYYLADQPLILNGQKHATYSLIYTVMETH
ncbi:glycosyltransferase family protein [Lacticaseibacillus saniviri]|uniref:hypothetical protein n=1 Tax=Lacticaseibacillus saniviri TaxID=931533 RepID=UPI001CDBED3C|nr:hypothetical protein [Lacticaseibacillus saniviri]